MTKIVAVVRTKSVILSFLCTPQVEDEHFNMELQQRLIFEGASAGAILRGQRVLFWPSHSTVVASFGMLPRYYVKAKTAHVAVAD